MFYLIKCLTSQYSFHHFLALFSNILRFQLFFLEVRSMQLIQLVIWSLLPSLLNDHILHLHNAIFSTILRSLTYLACLLAMYYGMILQSTLLPLCMISCHLVYPYVLQFLLSAGTMFRILHVNRCYCVTHWNCPSQMTMYLFCPCTFMTDLP